MSAIEVRYKNMANVDTKQRYEKDSILNLTVEKTPEFSYPAGWYVKLSTTKQVVKYWFKERHTAFNFVKKWEEGTECIESSAR